MSFEEFGKMLNRSLLISLDRIGGARLVRVFYGAGLAATAIWALNHLFLSFAFGFWEGIWGLLEIAVFGLFWVVGLRLVCEATIVFFEANKKAIPSTRPSQIPATLMEEVRGAIEELGEDEQAPPMRAAASTAPAKAATARSASAAKPATRTATPPKTKPRTAKRNPQPKTQSKSAPNPGKSEG